MPLRYRWSAQGQAQRKAGTENVFVVPIAGEGSIDLKEIQLSDNYGNMLTSKVDGQPTLPKTFALHQNYPNPFNATTQIACELPKKAKVKIEIFNVMRQKAVELLDRQEAAGVQAIERNGADVSGNPVASGVYFHRLASENFTDEKKMVLLK